MRSHLIPNACAIWGSLVIFLAWGGVAQGADVADVVEVEEHWSLQVGGPDTSKSGPQVTMTCSPTGDLYGDHFVVLFNHRMAPDFLPGGIQVQHHYCDSPECLVTSQSGTLLRHDGEHVSWVQRLKLADGNITFEVTDGTSQSWGSFGNSGELRLSFPSSLERLNGYKPSVSLEESGISYAGNRVSSLVLNRLVWRTAAGDEYELTAPIDIDADIDP